MRGEYDKGISVAVGVTNNRSGVLKSSDRPLLLHDVDILEKFLNN